MGGGDEQSKELGRSSSSHNPSANAEARMKFASFDALSELVWSPRNGLSLRCADFSFTGKPKLLSPNFFDIGQTNMALHSSRSTSSQQEEAGFRVNVQLRTADFLMMDRTEDDVNKACCSRRSHERNRPPSGIGGSVEDVKLERDEMVEEKVEISDGMESEEAETRVGISKRSLDSQGAIGGKTEALLANEQLRLGSAESQEEWTNHGDNKEEGDMANARVLYGDRLESTDENDLVSLAVGASKALVTFEGKGECLPEDETDVEKAGPSVSYRLPDKAKGKEKALSDGNFDGRSNESFGSVESCNSAGLLSRGKKRPGFEQQLIHGSKRLKTLSQECLGSTSKLKQDSSFMNWISNMTKGIWKGNEEHNPPAVYLTTTSDANGQVNTTADQQQLSACHLKENSGCRNTGFQSFFQSIYFPRRRREDATEMDFPNDANGASLRKLPCLPEQCLITNGDHLSSSDNEIGPVAEANITSEKNGFNQTSDTLPSENKHEDKEPNISLLSLCKSTPNEEQKALVEADGKVTQCVTNRNSGLESLWISRFSSKSSFPQKKDLHERITNEVTTEANDSASDLAKAHDSQKLLTDNNVILPSVSTVDRFENPKTLPPRVSSLRIETSEAISSMFARRLEALKHIMYSGSLAENSEKVHTDLICFYCGKKGHGLRDCLEVADTELRDLVQIISAQNGREESTSLCIRCFQLSHWAATCPNAPQRSSGAEDRAMKYTFASTSGTKLPFTDFTDVPKAVFDAVQLLRLTRTDVLKWMNTKKSVYGLEGFFLRLRLGKWEEGIEGTGYYVARIDGAREGQSSRRNSENSSVSVKVGGMTCFVESQFISNHDFLEEELKEWWRSGGKNAGRNGGDGIPSAEELSRKIQQRKLLGF